MTADKCVHINNCCLTLLALYENEKKIVTMGMSKSKIMLKSQ